MTKTFSFQAEVAKLLQLMIHSVYSEKEIFLRELISNSSDACDRLRYEAVTKQELYGEDAELKIGLIVDKNAKILIVHDNGIGMSKQDMIDNLGTIARSGTKAFIEKLAQEKEAANLIGQFGVGFYSAFMVAHKVEVISRKAGTEDCYSWQSEGGEGFSIEKTEKEVAKDFGRGTKIILHLNEDGLKFIEPGEIERIVHTYSDHISFPILLETIANSTDMAEASEESSPPEPKQLNTGSALWTRPKSEISQEDYTSFYKQVAVPFDDPLLTLHYFAEGRHEYSVLLFIPTLRPYDLYEPERKGRIKLYVRRVFITEDADMLPPFLRFVRGVIDSQDVPLNISREMLQNNPIVEAIRKAVTKRILSELKKTAEKDPELHLKIWEAFGSVIKEGIYEEPELRDDLFEISRFRSTKSDGWRSLKDYVAEMHEKQKVIYYLTGESLERLMASPLLEGFRARGIEVLLFSDQVDNFWVTNTLGYDGKSFQSLTQGEADLSEIPLLDGDEEQTDDEIDAKTASMIAKIKQILGEAISDVRISRRLVKSPVCLVAPSEGPDRGLDKIINYSETHKQTAPVLEINAGHDLLKTLREQMQDTNANTQFEDLSWLLFDQARILEGELPTDPSKFSERLNRLVLGQANTA